MKKKYKLNRSAFKAHTAEEAAKYIVSYQNTSWQERIQIAGYLNSIAFGFPENAPPRLDRTKFETRIR